MISLITGVTGQDGSYLAERLLLRGGVVHGMVRRSSKFNRDRIEHLRDKYPKKFFLHYADLADSTNLRRLLISIKPDELYHLAGQSHVGLSFQIPESTFNEVASATLSLLEICRDLESTPRLLLIGSSEMFGSPVTSPQDEETAHRPVNPYGCAKSCAFHLGQVYRNSFGLFVSVAIPYNHESVRRGSNFVTRKITKAVARISRGSEEVIELGNLESTRDWGFAPEYVEGMELILSHDRPDNFILASGTSTSVRDFARAAFEQVNIQLSFEGDGASEIGRDSVSGKKLIAVNQKYFRPSEPTILVGDTSKIRAELGWEAKTVGADVARRMVKDELLLEVHRTL